MVLGREGAHCMKMLWQHAASRGHSVVATESGAAEECEREVQQQEEEVAEETDDPEIGRLEPRAEKDWSNAPSVLKMRSVFDFRVGQENIKVCRRGLAGLPMHERHCGPGHSCTRGRSECTQTVLLRPPIKPVLLRIVLVCCMLTGNGGLQA